MNLKEIGMNMRNWFDSAQDRDYWRALELPVVRAIKSRRFRWAGHVVRIKESRSAFKIFTGKRAGKRPLGRPRCRWKDNIRMDLKEIGINTRN